MQRQLARPLACLMVAFTLAIAMTACAQTANPAAELIDGYAIGPARSLSGDEFHRLEATARDVVRTTWPGQPMSSIQLASAGTLADGSIQAGTESPFTFLVVVDIHGGGRHAFVLQCDDARVPAPDSCEASRNGPS